MRKGDRSEGMCRTFWLDIGTYSSRDALVMLHQMRVRERERVS